MRKSRNMVDVCEEILENWRLQFISKGDSVVLNKIPIKHKVNKQLAITSNHWANMIIWWVHFPFLLLCAMLYFPSSGALSVLPASTFILFFFYFIFFRCSLWILNTTATLYEFITIYYKLLKICLWTNENQIKYKRKQQIDEIILENENSLNRWKSQARKSI